MKKSIAIITVALLLCTAAACGERRPPEPETGEPQPEAGQPEVSAADGDSGAALPEETVAVIFSLAGNNGHATDVSIHFPETWIVDGDKVTADGRLVACMGMALSVQDDSRQATDAYFEGIEAELQESSGLEAVHELNLPELVGKYYYVNGWTVQADEESHIRYHTVLGDRYVDLTFIPNLEEDIEAQRIAFETYLATMELV